MDDSILSQEHYVDLSLPAAAPTAPATPIADPATRPPKKASAPRKRSKGGDGAGVVPISAAPPKIARKRPQPRVDPALIKAAAKATAASMRATELYHVAAERDRTRPATASRIAQHASKRQRETSDSEDVSESEAGSESEADKTPDGEDEYDEDDPLIDDGDEEEADPDEALLSSQRKLKNRMKRAYTPPEPKYAPSQQGRSASRSRGKRSTAAPTTSTGSGGLKCSCGVLVREGVVKKDGINQGRRFVSCPLRSASASGVFEGGCKTFAFL